MIKVKFYGTGGQGIVTAGKVLSQAVSLYEDKYAITVPAYGHERRGAPVNTSIIIDTEPVLVNSFVYEPDYVMVLDPGVLIHNVDVGAGIHEDSVLVLNAVDPDIVEKFRGFGFKTIYCADGTGTALEHIGLPIPNGSMLGVLAAAGLVGIDALEKALIDSFGQKAGEKNAKAARECYENHKKV
ncbi:MAG: 2-oxoacid:acceptor oxidoreductase family protein [Eubacteriales bacterium]|nr:2-oxoacid:acceptor oxidoreductase family protein [Eubacteriales bacterium]